MNKYLAVVFVAMVLLCAFAPTPANADSTGIVDTFVWVPCQQFYCGPQASGPAEITWQTPASPTPTSFCSNPFYCFSISPDLTVNGTDFGTTTVRFGYERPQDGAGFDIPALSIQGYQATVWHPAPLGPIGPGSSPAFNLGTFLMFGNNNLSSSPQAGTLTITSSVPEPSALLQTGAGLLLAIGLIAFWQKEPASTTRS
jgi:hypothetical protein